MNYYDFAKKDLKTAIINYQHGGDYDSIIVMCQQYLEKSLKQLVLLKCGEQLRTHKLITLSNRLGYSELDKYSDFFRRIQDCYFDRRYPGEDYIETTEIECSTALALISELKPFIESKIEELTNSKSQDAIGDVGIFSSVKLED